MQAFPITSRLQVGVIPTMERSETIPWWHRREAWESEPNAVGSQGGVAVRHYAGSHAKCNRSAVDSWVTVRPERIAQL